MGSAEALLKNFLEGDDDFKDITFDVKGREIRAHRNVLGGQSDVFHKMFTVDMKEKKTGMVTINDSSTTAFEIFIRSLYFKKVEPRVDLDTVIEVYILAQKYEVQRLKQILELEINNRLDDVDVETVFSCINLSLEYDSSSLKNYCDKQLAKKIEISNMPIVTDAIKKFFLIASKKASVKILTETPVTNLNAVEFLIFARKISDERIKRRVFEYMWDNGKNPADIPKWQEVRDSFIDDYVEYSMQKKEEMLRHIKMFLNNPNPHYNSCKICQNGYRCTTRENDLRNSLKLPK